MADQNQNPLLPPLDEDEQFVSSENFMAAETALDWDALVTRGNVNNSQQALSKWERDSLYVKFDPLIAARKEQAERNSFIFKAPKPPGAMKHNETIISPNQSIHDQETVPCTGNATFIQTSNGNVGDLQDVVPQDATFLVTVSPKPSKNGSRGQEDCLRAPTPEKNEAGPERLDSLNATVVLPAKSPVKNCNAEPIAECETQVNEVGVDDLCRDFERLGTKDASFIVDPKSPNKSQEEDRGETPETDVEELCEDLEQLNTKQMSLHISRTSPGPDENHEGDSHHAETFGDDIAGDGDIERLDTQDISLLIRAASPASTFGDEEMQDRHRELTPEMDLPSRTTPEMNVSRGSTPDMKPPRGSTPEMKVSRGSTPEMKVSRGSTPETKPPRGSTPEMKPPRGSTPEMKVSRGSTPETKPPRGSTPEMKPPRGSTPEMKPPRGSTLEMKPPKGSTPERKLSRGSTPPDARLQRGATPEMDLPSVETPEKHVAPGTVEKPPKQQQLRRDHPYADKLKRIAKLKENISQLNSKLEEEKKHKLKGISRQEAAIDDAINEYNKLKIRHEKSIEERERAIEECNDAKDELSKLESRFTDLLMLYETVKNKTANVEKNCVILQKREEILTQMLRKRETRDQSMKELYGETLEKVHHDLENKIREREKELANLKAKIRLCEVKTNKLEGEIEQVDRESEKLRSLCEDLMRN